MFSFIEDMPFHTKIARVAITIVFPFFQYSFSLTSHIFFLIMKTSKRYKQSHYNSFYHNSKLLLHMNIKNAYKENCTVAHGLKKCLDCILAPVSELLSILFQR